MGVFDDKKFDQLDWMSQVTETIESELNEILAKFPDRLDLDLNMLNRLGSFGIRYNYASTQWAVRDMASQLGCQLTWDEERKLSRCFKFEVDPNTILDLKNNTLTGKISIVKTIKTFDDDELQASMGERGLDLFRRRDWSTNGALSRMNEIIELIGGIDEYTKSKSANKKIAAIKGRLRIIFKNNEWRIRSTVLADKISHWIYAYILDSNLAAFTNFCKLKVMTHDNMPIYSIQEEQYE